MEKYGAIACPSCGSFDVIENGYEKVAVDRAKLASAGAKGPEVSNVGARFRCRSCQKTFPVVTQTSLPGSFRDASAP